MAIDALYSTATAASVAMAAAQAYPIRRVTGCRFAHRGYNDVYELDFEGLTRIGRLSAHRARGPANIAYETAFLSHLNRCGVVVGAPLTANDGRLWTEFEAPEGSRVFALFERVTGDLPLRAFLHGSSLTHRTLDDVRLLGADLARIHTAGETFAGPPSLYRLDRQHLLSRPIAWIRSAPVTPDALGAAFLELEADLEARLSGFEADLSIVACHGDNHGENTLVSSREGGERVVGWFDFDDCGPGYLAYDLAVLLWNLLHRTSDAFLDEEGTRVWASFIGGYRSARPIPDVDFAAIALFVSLRHVWYLGEHASRLPLWGTQALPPGGFQGQLARLCEWSALTTPASL
jgi:Ser/Thr protein kinase RdoA (MazF antagonist)